MRTTKRNMRKCSNRQCENKAEQTFFKNLKIKDRLHSLHPTRIQQKNQGKPPSEVGSTTDTHPKNNDQKITELEEQFQKVKDNNSNNINNPNNINQMQQHETTQYLKN